MANNYTQFSEALELEHPGEVEWAKNHFGLFERVSESEDPSSHPEFGAYEEMAELYGIEDGDEPMIGFDWSLEPRGKKGAATLYLFSEESGNVDHAAIFVQDYLRKFARDKCFSITWAATCSKPRAGEFGGGGIFITAKNIEWVEAWSWCDEKRKAFEGKK